MTQPSGEISGVPHRTMGFFAVPVTVWQQAQRYDPMMITDTNVANLLWVAAALVVLAVAVSSVANVLKRGPKTSNVPVVGGILSIVAVVLFGLAVAVVIGWVIFTHL